MAERTFYFFGMHLAKENFIDDATLLTQSFWDSLVVKFINETEDDTAKKYATIARDYIVYSKFVSDYNPLSQNAYVYIEFMAERHVDQYKKLVSAVISWANENYGMAIKDEHTASFPEDVTSVFTFVGGNIHEHISNGFKYHIAQQLGYIS